MFCLEKGNQFIAHIALATSGEMSTHLRNTQEIGNRKYEASGCWGTGSKRIEDISCWRPEEVGGGGGVGG